MHARTWLHTTANAFGTAHPIVMKFTTINCKSLYFHNFSIAVFKEAATKISNMWFIWKQIKTVKNANAYRNYEDISLNQHLTNLDAINAHFQYIIGICNMKAMCFVLSHTGKPESCPCPNFPDRYRNQTNFTENICKFSFNGHSPSKYWEI